MAALEGRTVILGISGGIAAYKTIDVCRQLVKQGAYVVPVLTEASLEFVGKSTWSALASEPARVSLFEGPDPIAHTRLGQNADLILICPATARVIGSYAAGISDDILTSTLLATRAPVLLCPAMHTEMWEHPSVQQNIQTLKDRGVKILGPFEGALAGGDVGMGRMAEPDEILIAVKDMLGGRLLEGLRILITAGGTRESIDPVRFVGNKSSGKQGLALAQAAESLGAEVDLVTTANHSAQGAIAVHPVTTAQEMMEVSLELSSKANLVIMAAAVADYRPKKSQQSKIRRTQSGLNIELEPTPDILKNLVQVRPEGQIIVGFAAETDEVLESGRSKLLEKDIDLIAINDVSSPNAGFDHDTNEVMLLDKSGLQKKVELASKLEVAHQILTEAHRLYLEIAAP